MIPVARDFSVRLVAIFASVTALIFARSDFFAALAIPLHNRIAHASRRLARLLAHLADGTFRPRPHTAKPGTKGGPPPIPLPRRRAWLVAQLGYHVAAYASHLEFLLRDPITQALIAAAPPEALKSLGRTLRPLAHLLGVDLPKELLPSPRPPRRGLSREADRQGGAGAQKPVKPPLPPLLPLHPQARPRDWPFMRFRPKIEPA